MSFSTQAQATSAIASLGSMANPGPGRTALVVRLNATLWAGTMVEAGDTTAPQFSEIVAECNRYLAFPV
jgi:hypothetical protein